MMQRMMPSRSSRSHIAYLVFVLPGRGFFVCENLIAASMPPTITSVRCSSLASCGAGVRAVGAERRFVLGERMAREVEAEHFFFHGQPFFLRELGQVGQRG